MESNPPKEIIWHKPRERTPTPPKLEIPDYLKTLKEDREQKGI